MSNILDEINNEQLIHDESTLHNFMIDFSESWGDQELIQVVVGWFDQHMGGSYQLIKTKD